MNYIGLFKWYDQSKGFGVLSTIVPQKTNPADVFFHHSNMKGSVPIKDVPILFDLRRREKGGFEAINCYSFQGVEDQWNLLFANKKYNLSVNTEYGAKDILISAIKTITSSEQANMFINAYNEYISGLSNLDESEILYVVKGCANTNVKELQQFVFEKTQNIPTEKKIELFNANKLALCSFTEDECLKIVSKITKTHYDTIIDFNTNLYLKIIEAKILQACKNFKFQFENNNHSWSYNSQKCEYESLNELYNDYTIRSSNDESCKLSQKIEEIISQKDNEFINILTDLISRCQSFESLSNKYRKLISFPKCFKDSIKEGFKKESEVVFIEKCKTSVIIKLMSANDIPVDSSYIMQKRQEFDSYDIDLIAKNHSIFGDKLACSIILTYLEQTSDIDTVSFLYKDITELHTNELTECLKSKINECYLIESNNFISNAAKYINTFGEQYIYNLSVRYLLKTHKSEPIIKQISQSNGTYREKMSSVLFSFHNVHREFVDDSFVSPLCAKYKPHSLEEISNDYIKQILVAYINNIKDYKKAMAYAENYSTEVKTEIENYLITILSREKYMTLWEKEICTTLPQGYLDDYFDDKEYKYNIANKWLDNKRLTVAMLQDIFVNTLVKIKGIKYHRYFKTGFLIYEYYKKKHWDIDSSLIEEQEKSRFDWALNLSYIDYRKICEIFCLYPDKIQVKILKFIFLNIVQGNIHMEIEELMTLSNCIPEYANYDYEDKPVLCLSISVIIESLISYKKKGQFLLDKDFYSLVYNSLANGRNELTQIGYFFDECSGKKKLYSPHIDEIKKFIYPIVGNDNRKWYIINFPYNQELVNEVRTIPGRRFHPQYKVWFAPESSIEEIQKIARNNRFLLLTNIVEKRYVGKDVCAIIEEYDKSILKENLRDISELKEWKEEMPHIIWCEGRESQNSPESDVWWCVGHNPCNACAIRLHREQEWMNYTLFDFCKILGIDLHETNKYGHFKGGKYALFVTSINRFNNLLERLKCRDCGRTLYPVESNYAINGATQFWCTNIECSKYSQKIYLNHCYTRRCRGVIDSRDSARCPNGLVICSSCGTCCSTEMFRSRLERLKATGAYESMTRNGGANIIYDLEEKINNNVGHRENSKYYCYKCGQPIIGNLPETICRNCQAKIKYRTY